MSALVSHEQPGRRGHAGHGSRASGAAATRRNRTAVPRRASWAGRHHFKLRAAHRPAAGPITTGRASLASSRRAYCISRYRCVVVVPSPNDAFISSTPYKAVASNCSRRRKRRRNAARRDRTASRATRGRAAPPGFHKCMKWYQAAEYFCYCLTKPFIVFFCF